MKLRVLLLLPVLALSLFAQTGARYLIITHDTFVQTIQPLAQWKTQKGMLAKVVPLSVTGGTPTEIRSYIQNAYNTWQIKPEYVLVVGAPDLLPASLDYPGDGSDDAYGDMTGNYEVEIPVGRFFCENTGECSTLVAKSLTYEKTPYAAGDSTWMRRGQTIVNEDDPPDQYYQPDCRYIRGLWAGAGFVQTESIISTNNNSTDVRNGINAGRGFVIYRGQCVGDWWPPFDQVDPSTLTNGAKLPVVVSGSCQTMTLYPGYSMQADSFVRVGTAQALRCAVAYFGTTNVGDGISLQRGTVSKGFFTAIFTEGRYKLGDACKRGKFYLDSLVPGNQQYYQEWNLLGDAELPLWTGKPATMAVAFDSAIPLGSYALNVNVTSGGSPVAGALVCAMMDTSVYVYGTSDAQGNVSLNVSTTHIGVMSLTATARNCLPSENSIQVFAGNMPYLSLRRTLIDDAGGNDNGLINPGEPIRLRVSLRNSGDSTAFGVVAGLTSADGFAVVTDSQQTYGDIAAHDSAWSAGFYAFTVAQSCTSGQSLNFALHIRDSHARLWTCALPLPVYAAAINYDSNLVSDPPPGGNGNSRLDPHENVRLIVTLRNRGTADLSAVRAVLRCASSYISISDSTGYYGDIPAGSSAGNGQNPYALSTSPNLPNTPITFLLVISGNGGTYSYNHTQQFTITPNGSGGPIGPDPYGYYCYDDGDSLSGRAPVFSWLELAPPGPGQTLPGITNSDAGLDTFTLPFRFKYYGTNFETLTLASNGFACFGKTGYRSAHNSHIPSADSAQYVELLPMWTDLNPDQNNGGHGDIYQYYNSSNHRWIEEFYQVAHYGSVNLQETFQLILLDPAYYPTPTGDGEILYQYETVADPNAATVGVQDPTWTRAIQYECNGVYDSNAAVIVNSRALRFTTLPPLNSSREWLTLAGIGMDDSTHGNGNHVAEPGEEILLTTFLANQGESAAVSVQGKLRSSDSNSLVLDSASAFPDIPAHGQANNGSDPYDVRIAGQPTDSLAQFTLAVSSAASSSVLYFTLPLGNVTGLRSSELNRLTRFVLSGYPNPSRAAAGVRYGLPRAANVNLGVFDLSGRLVRTLVQARTAPGWHELRWDGNDAAGRRAAAGVYFLRLNATDAGQVRQLVQKLEIIR